MKESDIIISSILLYLKMQNVEIEVGQLYIRMRREKTTYFILCKPMDQIDSLKRKIMMFHKGVEPTDIRLYIGTRVVLMI